MKVLVTGGAGFIGRWVVRQLLDGGHTVIALDDLSNGREENLAELEAHPSFLGLIRGSVTDPSALATAFGMGLDYCFHLAAKVVVQDSIDDPAATLNNDVVGTFRVLEKCREARVPILFMSSCMVYDRAREGRPIDEQHPVKPASPYAACKISAENLVLSYYHAYGLPAIVVRPFNTYGPFQKSTGEGGVVAIFLRRQLAGEPLEIYGDGTQTRDLLYVEDCARLVIEAAFCDAARGRIVNGGTGRDVTINDLAAAICPDADRIRHVQHIHPQSEIPKLVCDSALAGRLFAWRAEVDLAEGIERTRRWMLEQRPAPASASLPTLSYGKQWINDDDIEAVVNALRSDWITCGPKVFDFERAVADRCGVKYAVAVSSGTAALHAAYHAAGIGPDDEVITTPNTFIATANAALYCGARPVFADILPDTLCIDPEQAAAKIGPRTKAIVPVDFAGQPCDYDRLGELARQNKLVLIADAAHSLGASFRGRPVGQLADMTILSFHPVKHVTTGEGGMILTDSKEFCIRLNAFRNHGLTSDPEVLSQQPGPWYREMIDLGYNYRLTDLQCALGHSQLRRLDEFVARRREIAALYDALLADAPHLTLPRQAPGAKSSYHLYVVRVDFDAAGLTRRELFERLREVKIAPQVHYIPVHLHPYYREHIGARPGDFPVAERYYEQALSLPMYPRLTDADVRRVAGEMTRILRGGGR